jgi:DNA-directed RNA polymerase specialized sigma24 family protein
LRVDCSSSMFSSVTLPCRPPGRARLRTALGQLASPDREVLVLRYLEQLTTTEAAAVLGVSGSAVKMRVLRALQRLRELLKSREERP